MPVAYAYSEELIEYADKLPSNKGRASRVNALIESFGLMDKFDGIIRVKPCTQADLEKYHDKNFIKFLLTGDDGLDAESETEGEESDESYEGKDEPVSKEALYGLHYDCPPFDGLEKYVKLVAGATLQCADYLVSLLDTDIAQNTSKVAINWTGGRHHAKRAACSGFCYVNDINLGIQRLRTKFDKVLYVDLDLHHGDGVETAFAYSDKVKSVSVHRYERGFFPGTGGMNTTSRSVVNIPTKYGLSDKSFIQIFDTIIVAEKEDFQPDAVVVTTGCDGLARDELREWNLSFSSFEYIIDQIVNSWKLPTLLLGGGGYHTLDTARCLAICTAAALNVPDRKQWVEIPMHDYFNEYVKDNYSLRVESHVRHNTPDENSEEYLKKLADYFEHRR
ncbi:histone deacetylase RPD3 [Sugiyamaella lignohabitans]|uniref:histone deacetylase n=1 Tax=Sugiyamaella lignohabitans TaxID=796027 RepID=A0A161HFP4_9ASCO|nr:histone deacetylase RPD3 [Sugiyamaella lignohabitans]ANB14410.1 histone deacetylase RPD3 [Sugiyamaella lignohabitans]